MKHFIILLVLILFIASCKKENTSPKLSFSAEERKWFTYQIGQSIKFKNSLGDSIIYSVANIRNDFKTEYRDPLTNPIEIGIAELIQ
jgi:cytochrome c-type biogenesis protein CcmH/NrfF